MASPHVFSVWYLTYIIVILEQKLENYKNKTQKRELDFQKCHFHLIIFHTVKHRLPKVPSDGFFRKSVSNESCRFNWKVKENGIFVTNVVFCNPLSRLLILEKQVSPKQEAVSM